MYEKRLIEQYISENGSEPSTGEPLTTEDLLPIQSSRIVRPRPPALTSIPALLATFQNEWDSLALETYNLKEQLARTREELATALYQHDAAVRVIARLSKERDEARESLSKVTVTDGTGNGEEMVVDSVETLSEELVARVDEVHQSYVWLVAVACLERMLTSYADYQKVERSVRSPRTGLLPMQFQHSIHSLLALSLLRKPPLSISKATTLLWEA